MGDVRSTWFTLRKGASKASALGPFIFNRSRKGLLYSMTRHVDIFESKDTPIWCYRQHIVINYADSNTIVYWVFSIMIFCRRLKMHVILC